MTFDKNETGKRKWSNRLLPATKQDLIEMEKRLMATIADLDKEIQEDLTDAATAIETALANALKNVTLPPDVQPQIDHIKTITAAMRSAATGTTPTITVPDAPVA